MQIDRVDPEDTASVEAVVDVLNAATAVDQPAAHPWTVPSYTGFLRHGWDEDAPRLFAAREDGRVVGAFELETSSWDNPHLAWSTLVVHPELRRAGRGTALVEAAAAETRRLGRCSLGGGGWDNPALTGFAARLGLPLRAVEVCRRQVLADLEPTVLGALLGEARAAATAYELVRVEGRTPEPLLPAVAAMAESINDAPTDDLEIDDEVYPPARVVAYERAQAAQGQRLYRLLARHRDSGEVAGHTVVAVLGDRPWLAEQHDTTVVRAHRGHRLGLLLKAEMVAWLAEAEPQVVSVDTWNAESNAHMIDVNARLGYRVVGRTLLYQRDV